VVASPVSDDPGCEYAPGATDADEMRIRDVEREASAPAQEPAKRTAHLELTLLDEHGAPTAARLGIYDVVSGREVLASPDAVPIVRYLEEVQNIAIPTSGSTGPERRSPRCSTPTTTSANAAGICREAARG
jgi:hypothetical protein